MVKKLFEYIIENGVLSEKKSVIDFFSKKDKVYTKKVAIPGDKLVENKCKIKFISLTSISGKFDDVTPEDVRVNVKNPYGMWANVYADSLSKETIGELIKRLGIK